MGEDVARWPFPALWPPAGNEGEEMEGSPARCTWPGGRDKVSATMLSALAMWRISLVYSATYANCLHWRAVHGSDTREMAWVNGLWSV